MEGSWRWFRDVVGLPAKGLFPSPTMGRRYASKKECEALWGKRKSNNGFRYTMHEDESLKTRIEELIRQVYQRKQTPNSDINISFACGVLAERKGFNINWAKFAEAVHRRKRSFTPLPEYKNSSSSHDGDEEEGEEEEEEDSDEEEDDEEEVEEQDVEEDDSVAGGNGLHEGNSPEKNQGGDELLGTKGPTTMEQPHEEVVVQPQPEIKGGREGDQLQSPREGVVSTDATRDCIGDEPLGTKSGTQFPFGEEVPAQVQLNILEEKLKPEGETHVADAGLSDVAPVGYTSASSPLVSEGLHTLATQIDENGVIVMERAVRLKEVKLREDQVKFKRELLQFKIGQLALKRKYLQIGSPTSMVEEEKNLHMGEGSGVAKTSLATQIKDINGIVLKKRQTVQNCTNVLEAIQSKLVDLIYKMNSAEGRLHSAKVQVLGLENIDGKDVHKFGLAEVQDSILELEKICHEIGEVRADLRVKAEHHKSELTKLHHYEACLHRLQQKTYVEMEVPEGTSLTFPFRVLPNVEAWIC